MIDLINRSELLKILENRKREHYENYESFRNYMGNRRLEHETEYEECKRILAIVASLTSVEAVPVVHGEWIAQDESLTKFKCSVCNGKNYGGHEKFCPNCGADMREKV